MQKESRQRRDSQNGERKLRMFLKLLAPKSLSGEEFLVRR